MTGGGGIIYYSVEKFGRPFSRVEERLFSVPQKSYLRVSSDKYKIVFILNGESIHEAKGIDSNHIGEGDILMAPQNLTQYYRSLSDHQDARIHAFLLFFDPKYLPLLDKGASYEVARSPERLIVDFIKHHLGQTRLLKDAQTQETLELISKIRQEAEGRPFGYRHRINALCQNLIVTTARITSGFLHSKEHSNRPGGGTVYNDIIEGAKEYIFRNLDKEITLGQIAWSQRKSEEHLARVFKAVTGQTVFEYVRDSRLEQAKIYLRDTRLTLTEIAKKSGFSSLSYFSRSFHSSLGITPSQYRKEMVIDPSLISEERKRK